MPARYKPGRGRIDLKYPPPFVDMIAEAAQTKLHISLSQLVRDTLARELERLGYRRADIDAALAPPAPLEPKRRRRKKS